VSPPSPEDGKNSSFRNVVFSGILEYRMMDKVQKPSNCEDFSLKCPLCCSILSKNGVCQQILLKLLSIHNESPFRGSFVTHSQSVDRLGKFNRCMITAFAGIVINPFPPKILHKPTSIYSLITIIKPKAKHKFCTLTYSTPFPPPTQNKTTVIMTTTKFS
jgi:hypothetical protein